MLHGVGGLSSAGSGRNTKTSLSRLFLSLPTFPSLRRLYVGVFEVERDWRLSSYISTHMHVCDLLCIMRIVYNSVECIV